MTSTTPNASSSSTSGSGSSQSVPSSMESGATLSTQDVVDGYLSEPEETESGWGKLIPVGRGFDLVGKLTLCIVYLIFVYFNTCLLAVFLSVYSGCFVLCCASIVNTG